MEHEHQGNLHLGAWIYQEFEGGLRDFEIRHMGDREQERNK